MIEPTPSPDLRVISGTNTTVPLHFYNKRDGPGRGATHPHDPNPNAVPLAQG